MPHGRHPHDVPRNPQFGGVPPELLAYLIGCADPHEWCTKEVGLRGTWDVGDEPSGSCRGIVR